MLRVVKNYFWMISYQILIVLVPLVTVPYVNRTLNPEGVGIVAYTNAFAQYFILFAGLGINLYGTRMIAYVRHDKKKLSQNFWEIFTVQILASLLTAVVYFLFVAAFSKLRFFYILQGIAILAVGLDVSWLFQGLENFRITVLRNVFVKVVSIALIFSLVKVPHDIAIYIFILGGSQLIGNLTLIPRALKMCGSVSKIKFHSLGVHLIGSTQLLIPQIAVQCYLQMNRTVLGLNSGMKAAGFYDNSDKIIRLALVIGTSLATVMLPMASNEFAQHRLERLTNLLKMSFQYMLAYALPVMLGFWVIARPFTTIFFGSKFMPVSGVLQIECFMIIFVGISTLIGNQYLVPSNQIKGYTRSVIMGALVNGVLVVPLTIWKQAQGAAISIVIAEATVALLQLWMTRRQVRLNELFFETWKYVVAAVVMTALLLPVTQHFPVSILSVLVEIIIGVVIYGCALQILHPVFVIKLERQIKHTLRGVKSKI